MVAKLESSSNLIPPPAKSAPKDRDSTRISVIAFPLIAAVAAFILLSLKSAIVITAIVTVGALTYLYGENQPIQLIKPIAKPTAVPSPLPTPSCPPASATGASQATSYSERPVHLDVFYRPSDDGEFATVRFNSAERAQRFQLAFEDQFKGLLSSRNINDDVTNKALSFIQKIDEVTADDREQVVAQIQKLIQ